MQIIDCILCKYASFKAAIDIVESSPGFPARKPKKQRVDQKIVKDNYDTSDDKVSSGWYWYDSFDKDYFDLDKELASETQGKEEEKKLTESGSQFLIVDTAVLG